MTAWRILFSLQSSACYAVPFLPKSLSTCPDMHLAMWLTPIIYLPFFCSSFSRVNERAFNILFRWYVGFAAVILKHITMSSGWKGKNKKFYCKKTRRQHDMRYSSGPLRVHFTVSQLFSRPPALSSYSAAYSWNALEKQTT